MPKHWGTLTMVGISSPDAPTDIVLGQIRFSLGVRSRSAHRGQIVDIASSALRGTHQQLSTHRSLYVTQRSARLLGPSAVRRPRRITACRGLIARSLTGKLSRVAAV